MTSHDLDSPDLAHARGSSAVRSDAGSQTSAHLLVHCLDPLERPHHDAEFELALTSGVHAGMAVTGVVFLATAVLAVAVVRNRPDLSAPTETRSPRRTATVDGGHDAGHVLLGHP